MKIVSFLQGVQPIFHIKFRVFRVVFSKILPLFRVFKPNFSRFSGSLNTQCTLLFGYTTVSGRPFYVTDCEIGPTLTFPTVSTTMVGENSEISCSQMAKTAIKMTKFRVLAQKKELFSGFSGFSGSLLPISGFSGFSGFSGSARHPV